MNWGGLSFWAISLLPIPRERAEFAQFGLALGKGNALEVGDEVVRDLLGEAITVAEVVIVEVAMAFVEDLAGKPTADALGQG